jgi:hypothetical protein
MKTQEPSRREIARAIQIQIDGLVDSFTDRIGPDKGKISNPKIAREVVSLKGALRIVMLTIERQIAVEIVDFLFVNGAGQKADRLVLELPGKKDGGGWSKGPAIDRIEELLKKRFSKCAK